MKRASKIKGPPSLDLVLRLCPGHGCDSGCASLRLGGFRVTVSYGEGGPRDPKINKIMFG